MKKTSEFGKGFVYPLGLFLAHAESERFNGHRDENDDVSLWFYATADHLFCFTPEKGLTKTIRDKATIFRDKCLVWRMPMSDDNTPTKKDKEWAINEAKELLFMTDKAMKVNPIRGAWE
jgi:hypothetical protein